MTEKIPPNIDVVKEISFVLWWTMGLNILATLFKLIVGYLTGSLSIIADGFDSLFDSASNIVGLIGIRYARKPPDEEHPYGHRKFETMAALIVSMLLFITAWEILNNAINRIVNQSLIDVKVNILSFSALIFSIIIHNYVVWYESRAGRRLRSDFLVADASHTKADIFLSVSVMGGLIGIMFGYPILDPILALVIALFIARIGIDIIKESIPTLVDKIVIRPEDIDPIVLTVPDVLAVHHIRTRGHESAIYADLQITVPQDITAEKAHDISREVEQKLRDKYVNLYDIVIHIEPGKKMKEL